MARKSKKAIIEAIKDSGAFTEGGGVPVCGHPDSCDKKRADIIGVDQYHWRARVLNEDMSIPNWCPLLLGDCLLESEQIENGSVRIVLKEVER